RRREPCYPPGRAPAGGPAPRRRLSHAARRSGIRPVMSKRSAPEASASASVTLREWWDRANLRRCVGGGAVSGIAPPLGGALILLASTIVAIAEPLPVRKVGSCPAGYVSRAHC